MAVMAATSDLAACGANSGVDAATGALLLFRAMEYRSNHK